MGCDRKLSSWNRRKSLYLLAAAFSAAVLQPLTTAQRTLGARGKAEWQASELVGALFHNKGSARRLGRIYAEMVQAEGSRRRLKEMVFAKSEYVETTVFNLDHARTVLIENIRADYRKGNTAMINGWVMSRTELRLCTLAYLEAHRHG